MRNIRTTTVEKIPACALKSTGIFKLHLRVFSIVALLLFGSCKKLIDIDVPKNAIVAEGVFKDPAGVQAAIAGMYGTLYGSHPYSYTISLFSGLLSDELIYNGTDFDEYSNNSLIANETEVANTWINSYSAIYQANTIIEGVAASSSLSTDLKNQSTGEALFVRAFCHFYLVNLFGDVPLITTSVVQENELAPRTPAADVYTQIIKDLEQASTLLTEIYPSGGNRRRVNKYAATALLARVYLYQKDYVNAEAKATEVINANSIYHLQTDLNSVFLIPSTETIWCLDASIFGYTAIGSYTIPNAGVKPNYTLQPGLLAAFEAGDQRAVDWIGVSVGDNYPYKYKTKTKLGLEDDVVLRLAEQYLIRAEARAEQNNIAGAQDDINAIRNRAGLTDVTVTDQASGLADVAQERRVELFVEWGHRWLDLKRTGKVDNVMSALKLGLWEPTDALFPIPSVERATNPNLTQNPGYN